MVAFRHHQIYRHNLAVWLHRAGYRTIHLGKFLNQYGGQGPETPTRTVPPGWDEWQTDATDNSTRLYYGYPLNQDGAIRGPFGSPDYADFTNKNGPGRPLSPPPLESCNYQEDQLTNRAVRQIDRSAPGGPFYLQLDYNAPHGDSSPPIGPEPARRHYNSAIDTPLPSPPGFNEADISDKPSFIRDDAEPLGPTDFRRMRIEYQKSLESLRSVDEGVRRLIAALRRSGELSRTYVFFSLQPMSQTSAASPPGGLADEGLLALGVLVGVVVLLAVARPRGVTGLPAQPGDQLGSAARWPSRRRS